MLKEYLEIGKIVASRGLNGEVKIEPWCDNAEVLCNIKCLYWNKGEEKIKVEYAKVHKSMAIVKLEGIDSIEDANFIRNKIVYAKRDDIPLEEGSYFIQDLQGMKVKDVDNGSEYGILEDVFKTGANDVYKILSSDKKEYLIPVIPDVVKEINIDEEEILICPIKGLFDDDN